MQQRNLADLVVPDILNDGVALLLRVHILIIDWFCHQFQSASSSWHSPVNNSCFRMTSPRSDPATYMYIACRDRVPWNWVLYDWPWSSMFNIAFSRLTRCGVTRVSCDISRKSILSSHGNPYCRVASRTSIWMVATCKYNWRDQNYRETRLVCQQVCLLRLGKLYNNFLIQRKSDGLWDTIRYDIKYMQISNTTRRDNHNTKKQHDQTDGSININSTPLYTFVRIVPAPMASHEHAVQSRHKSASASVYQ